MSEFYVYMHLQASTGKPFYVGKGRGKRAWSVKSRNSYWHNVVGKYDLEVHIVASNLTEKESLALEVSTIALIGLENLTNMTAGGEGSSGLSPSIETRCKISAANRNPSQETRELKRLAATGRKLSEKSREKLSASKRNPSAETRLKMSAGRKSWAFTEETKEKMRLAISGRTLTDEWKRKIGDAGKTPVRTVSGLTFDSAKNAAKWLRETGHPKADASSISKCAKGKLQSAYGQIWRYVTA
jgi:hypothetical protein